MISTGRDQDPGKGSCISIDVVLTCLKAELRLGLGLVCDGACLGVVCDSACATHMLGLGLVCDSACLDPTSHTRHTLCLGVVRVCDSVCVGVGWW